MAGSFIHTLVATDVCSGWTEFVPLLAREQSLVVEELEMLFSQEIVSRKDEKFVAYHEEAHRLDFYRKIAKFK